MELGKKTALFCAGGLSYVALELLWRGRSHGSMFLAGGSCFLLLGRLRQTTDRTVLRALGGAGIITAVDLMAGLLFNRGHTVWDYRQLPFNYHGQICLVYSLLWVPVSFGAMLLYRLLTKKLRLNR